GRRRQVLERRFRKIPCPMQKSARPRSVHKKLRLNVEPVSSATAAHAETARLASDVLQRDLIEVFHSHCPRLLHEEVIKVRTIPMSVGNFVMRTGRNEQFVCAICSRVKGLPQFMMVKREAALESTGNLRMA